MNFKNQNIKFRIPKAFVPKKFFMELVLSILLIFLTYLLLSVFLS